MRFAVLTGTLLASLLAVPQQRLSDPEAQLQAALHEEMVVGNLPSAMEQYKSIMAQSGVSRNVAATALLHIGECQQKLGRNEDARNTYLRVIKQFGDQSRLVAQAREQLDNARPHTQDEASASFGVGTASFPVNAAAGKHVKYSGYIKTEAVTSGWAGLWWRVDGEPGSPALAFDNMQDRGATGTTPWTRYEIDLDVPSNATHIYFGVLHIGSGQAWFDTLQVELDGAVYTDNTHFDLDFESSSPRGFYTGGKGYRVMLNREVAHTGQQSLHSRFLGGQKDLQSSESFGVGTATFPVNVAAGKHVKYSGYIRTEGMNWGWAGLWWRVDGARGQMPLAFDNMQDRGATGTTPWTRYEINLDVPVNATNINFGVLHTGDGDAWFDTLRVELDGVTYTNSSLFDLDFESSRPLGFYTGGKGYKVELDQEVAHTGRQSLRSHFLGAETSHGDKFH